MTLRKQLQGSDPSEAGRAHPGDRAGPYDSSRDIDKSRSAAEEAQRLASQGSWADHYVRGTPATSMTPAASTIDEEENQYGEYPSAEDPLDPPPIYTPSDTSASQSLPPASPGAPTSSVEAAVVGSPTSRAPHVPSDSPGRTNLADARPQDTTVMPESFPPWFVGRQTGPEKFGPPPWGYRGRWRRQRWHQDPSRRERVHRSRRACCFLIALLVCLWLLVPGLFEYRAKTFQNTPVPTATSNPETGGGRAYPWRPGNKREYRQCETSNSITGTFLLYDLLDLRTTSGSISITISPQPGEKPAVVKLATTSGSINVRMVPRSLHRFVLTDSHNRTYQTSISARSGSVGGNLIHGNGGTTSVETESGSISLNVYAVGVGESDHTATLSTTSGSGSQDIKVLSAEPGRVIKALEASHFVKGSGHLRMRYPPEWEGQVHAKSFGHGNVRVAGKGLEVQRQGDKDVYGWRGSGGDNGEGIRQVEVVTKASGSVNFQC